MASNLPVRGDGNGAGSQAMMLRPYAGEEHRPFTWTVDGRRAALLVHGFPGTPAEMRSVGEVLVAHGYSAHGILLPGFGPEISKLADTGLERWLDFLYSRLRELLASHDQVVLVGNSMGGALATSIAAKYPVTGLILFSPFWRIEQRWIDMIFPVGRHFLPRLYPFKDADFSLPKTRTELSRVLGPLDLDDGGVQEQVRRLELSTSTLAHVREAGRLGYRMARRIQSPVLIFQGRDDAVVQPHLTRALAPRYPALAGYVEVPGDHDLVAADDEHGSVVRHTIGTFLRNLSNGAGGPVYRPE